MIPYSSELYLGTGNNYGIVKTEALFRFGQRSANNIFGINETRPYDWLVTPVTLEKNTIQAPDTARSFHDVTSTKKPEARHAKKKETKKSKNKKSKRKEKKVNKCVFKIMKDKNKEKRRKSKKKQGLTKKKFVIPLILGLLAAKSVLIPIALKALAFMSAKGFLMGFFSTILASFLSLKGMFDHNHRYQDRGDEKTQVEIIQVPAKDEHHYDDHYYKRLDYIPLSVMPPAPNLINNHIT